MIRQSTSPAPSCPHCGFGAGIYAAPRERRTASTPIRCVSCGRDAVMTEWISAKVRDVPHAAPYELAHPTGIATRA